jgi:hypothetical protein
MFLRLFGGAIAVALMTLGWTAPALSSPLDPRQVPADVKWVAHLDADALRSSPVLRAFMEHCLGDLKVGKPTDSSHAWPCAALSFDKVQSITLFGNRLGMHNGAAIVRGKWDRDELIQKLKAQPEMKVSTRGGQTIYTWTRFKGTDLAHDVALALPKPDTLVFAADADLVGALNVVEGKGATLEGKRSPLTAAAPEGTVLLARADGLKPEDIGPQFTFFRQLSGLDYRLVDHNGQYTEELTLQAHSDAAADKVKKGFEGILALAALCFAENKDLVALLDKAEIKKDGQQVRVRFQGASADVARQIPRICDAVREHWKTRMTLIHQMLGEKPDEHSNRPDR